MDGEGGLGGINFSLLSTTTSFVLTNSSVEIESIGIVQRQSELFNVYLNVVSSFLVPKFIRLSGDVVSCACA